jgi:putative oxidoreductase
MHIKLRRALVSYGRSMPVALLAARILFSVIFVLAAPRHFTAEAISHAADLGVPWPRLAVPLSGAIALAGGLGVLLGYQTRLSALALIVFLVPVTLGMHAFWRIADPVQRHVQLAMFVKNVALIGGALAIAVAGAGGYSLDAMLD